jgi:hypothetical protein
MKSDKRAGEARLFLRKCCVLHSVFEDIDSNEPSRVNAICASELGDSCLKTVREWVWVVGLELNPNLNNKLQTNRDQMGLGCWTKWVWVVGFSDFLPASEFHPTAVVAKSKYSLESSFDAPIFSFAWVIHA